MDDVPPPTAELASVEECSKPARSIGSRSRQWGAIVVFRGCRDHQIVIADHLALAGERGK